MTEAGFDVVPGEHPIVPVMLGDAALAARFAERLLDHGRLRDRLLVPGRAAWARRASARRCVPGTTAISSTARSMPSSPPVASSVSRIDRRRRTHESTGQGRARARNLAAGHPGAEARRERRAHPDPQDRDLRHRHAHLHLGRVGAEDDPGADGGRATSTAARSSRSAARCRVSRSATGSRARATSPAATAATAAPVGGISAATPSASASIDRGASRSTS